MAKYQAQFIFDNGASDIVTMMMAIAMVVKMTLIKMIMVSIHDPDHLLYSTPAKFGCTFMYIETYMCATKDF